ncbi:DUF3293 domain-containing protein [Polynucleobacter sp. MWH-UH35A]|uniref:DUF3293 domain-containing protein n=1 Tax=Polynucleobacter sp. MWH-UH35A TaxID=1855619 RepID=UPI001BFE800A|nr:DUF3293 domain-containing protein [Polynucleobacter sp. MWH-UH35A]QWD60753.1 DUF3293 domain-containing protein [Polynucleobacter sp. MWH-UH35A]
MTRTISENLASAYLDACYVVHSENGGTVIRVDQVNPNLARLMKKHGVNSAAFLTAFNPYSQPATEAENISNQNSLLADIGALGLKSVLGEGSDPRKIWPSERSVLALGISLQDAERLADRYQQNAFLWIAGDEGSVELNLRYPVERSCT